MGRPTKCTGEIVEALNRIVEDMTPANFAKYCSVESLAYHLGVHRDTIHEWRRSRRNKAFCEAFERWEAKRNYMFMQYVLLGGMLFGEKRLTASPAVLIFLMKNWLGYKDVADVNIGGTRDVIISLEPPEEPEEEKKDEGQKEV
jgi:hypothetical protein